MKKREIVFGLLLLVVLGKLLPSESYNYVIMALACITSVFWVLQNSQINKILFAAYSIRLLIAFVAYFDIYPIEGSRSDAVFFLEEADKIYAPTLNEMWKNYQDNPLDFFPFIIAIVYFIFGQSQFLMVFFNVILSTLVIRNTFLFTSKIHSAAYGKVASLIVCLLPYSIMFGATVTREPLITFLLTYSFVLLANRKMTRKSLLSLLATLFLLALIHGAFVFYLVLVLCYFAISAFVDNRSFGQRVVVLILSGLILVAGYFLLTNFVVSKVGGILDNEASGELITEKLFRNAGSAIDGSNYRGRIEIRSFGDLFLNFGGVVVPFFLQPYLWRLIELKSYFLLFFGSIPWHILLFLNVLYFKLFLKIVKENLKIFLLIGGLSFVFAFGSSQINQAIRHNHKFIPVVIGLFSPVLVRNPMARRWLSFKEENSQEN